MSKSLPEANPCSFSLLTAQHNARTAKRVWSGN